jgi:V/A-type H+/Na+-transporting ATPase subunit E
MQNKLQELTDKIYREGISKANDEAENIIAKAREEAKVIVDNAEKKAQATLNEAKTKADEVLKNGVSELKISFRHAMNTLKQDLEKTISSRLLSDKISESFKDDNFVADLIATIYKNWKPEGSGKSVEALVPEDKMKSIEKRLKAEVASELGTGIILKPVASIKSGFEIVSSDGGFKISATANDIEAYLKEFIRPKLNNLLFEEN